MSKVGTAIQVKNINKRVAGDILADNVSLYCYRLKQKIDFEITNKEMLNERQDTWLVLQEFLKEYLEKT